MTDRLRFALLGHPVRHSISPAVCLAAFRALGLPHTYTAIDVPSESSLSRVLGEVRNGALKGVNITVPYKRAALEMVDELAPSARETSATNVIVSSNGKLVAHNTDAAGLAADLGELGLGRPKLRAIIVGAGGAGLAAIVALKKLGFSVVAITSRSWSTTEKMLDANTSQLARNLGALTTLWPEFDVPSSGKASQVLRLQFGELAVQADCVVQATSAGMLGGPPGDAVASIVPWAHLAPHALAYDVVYNPRITPFLREAKARGFSAAGGLGMLVRQAAAAIEIWTGVSPDISVMKVAGEEALARG